MYFIFGWQEHKYSSWVLRKRLACIHNSLVCAAVFTICFITNGKRVTFIEQILRDQTKQALKN